MPDLLRYPLQAAVYAGTALLIGYFAAAPAYVHFPPDRAQIKLTLVHGAERRETCHQRSVEELQQLAPNMRKKIDCPRERLPVWIEVMLDDHVLYRDSLPPTGLSKDGPSRAYQRFEVEPGRHRLRLYLRDSARTDGYDFQLDKDIELTPQQSLAIDFRAEMGGFLLLGGPATSGS
jgi:hypothetical protein